MKGTTTAYSLLFAAVIFMSCNNGESDKDKVMALDLKDTEVITAEEKSIEQKEPDPLPGTFQQVASDSVEPSPKQNPVAPVVNPDWDKKIIKTASAKYEVKSFDQFNKEVRERVRKFGGYVAQEDNYQYEDRKEISLVIKVPVAQFEPMMNEMQSKDVKQIERSIKTEDVTGQVIDTKSRLEAKKEMRLKYLEFLRQSKNMEEVLQVQSEINSIQEEIEAASARIQSLTKQAAYSTINLSFYQPLEGFKTPVPDDNSFFSKTGEAFSRGADMIKGLLLVIISIWPLILATLAGIFIWKRRRQPAKLSS
jgi:hypothetical protein